MDNPGSTANLRNALLYVSNDNIGQFRKMQNSINSFARHNRDMLDSIDVYVVTSAAKPDLGLVDAGVRVHVVREMSYDYSTIPMPRAKWPWNTYSRWEVFGNPLFAELDNVLYLDNDTVFRGSVNELFQSHSRPTVSACLEPIHHDHVSAQLGRRVLSHTYCFGVMLVTPKLIGRATLRLLFDRLINTAQFRAWQFADQDAANLVFGQAPFDTLFFELPSRFGRSPYTTDSSQEEARRQAVVVHNCGRWGNYPLEFLAPVGSVDKPCACGGAVCIRGS